MASNARPSRSKLRGEDFAEIISSCAQIGLCRYANELNIGARLLLECAYSRHTRTPSLRKGAGSNADFTSMKQPWRTIFCR